MIRLEGTTRRWIGLSSDEKPYIGMVRKDVDGGKDGTPANSTIQANDITPGSSFFESDTGKIYRWDGFGWTYFVPVEEDAYILSRISEQLAVITRILAEGFEIEEVSYDLESVNS